MAQQDAADGTGATTAARDDAGYARAQRDKALHEEAERIAVPSYDWVAQPISGLLDALISAASHHPHVRHHGHKPDGKHAH